MKTLSILLVFILLAGILTFPLALKTGSAIPGFHSTDEAFAPIWYFWWQKFSHANALDERNCKYLAYPFGFNYASSPQIYLYWQFLFGSLAKAVNGILLYNTEIMLGFVLSGFFMYLLVRFLTASRICGLFSGIAFAFCPYHFARAWQHFRLASTQWIVLFIFSLVLLRFQRRWANVAFVALSFFLVAAYEFYYTFFMIITFIIFLIFVLVYDKKDSFGVIKKALSAIGISAVLLLPAIFSIAKGLSLNIGKAKDLAAQGYIRAFSDLFEQSARPLSYFLPSTEHPLFGGLSRGLIGTKIYGMSFTEHALYLGWTVIILALLAIKLSRKRQRAEEGESGKKEVFTLIFFLSLAISSWIFSQPPWWQLGPIKIFMPSFFLYKILPMFRAYCRFGIVLMLALSVLAGLGLKFILGGVKNQRNKIYAGLAFCSAVLFEFWNYPPYKVIDLSRAPAVYCWLKQEPPDTVVAEYPMDASSPNELYKLYQTHHKKKIINVTYPGTYANAVARRMTGLSSPETAAYLKWLGVKFVLVHRDDYLNTDLIKDRDELRQIPFNPGLRPVKNFAGQDCLEGDIMCLQKIGPVDVYEVIASPVEPRIKHE